MSGITGESHRAVLRRLAYEAMKERGFLTDFSPEVMEEIAHKSSGSISETGEVLNLTSMPWCSIDNDSSLDLDQLTAAAALDNKEIKVFVAIADVDVAAKKLSAIDVFASRNTLSVYTPAVIFPMLPERLSTDITSLNYGRDRYAIIVEMTISLNGALTNSRVYRAMVRNKAKLAYDSVAAWLENYGPMPAAIAEVEGLGENIKLQSVAAQRLKALRHSSGALHLATMKARPVFEGDEIKTMEPESKNPAKDIIEDFMIAANGVTARFMESKNFPSIRRVVHTPKRWDRIVSLASEKKYSLPLLPDAKPLEEFLLLQKKIDPDGFPDLSVAVIKLLGPGEYALDVPGSGTEGHFGLAVRDYAHSTAPNRRYPDLITQRLLKAAIEGSAVPYTVDELDMTAKHCTQKENDARKVERRLDKSAAAILLSSMIGQEFDGIITGATEKGTYVRILQPPAEGRLAPGMIGLDVGQKVRVVLVSTDVERGFVDFNAILRK